MKISRFILIILTLVFIAIGFLYLKKPNIFNFLISPLQKKTSIEYVTMSEVEFKNICTNKGGDYLDDSYFGFDKTRLVSCGYNKSSDAGRRCYSEKQANSCVLCKLGSSCALAAGDFGPEHCYCNSYERVVNLKINN